MKEKINISNENVLGKVEAVKKYKFSEESRRNMSLAHLGKKKSEQHKQNIRLANLGRKDSIERIEKMKAGLRGKYTAEKASNWKGGTTDLNRLIRARSEYRDWVSNCMTRDNWTCKTCNQYGGKLQVHHINDFSNLLRKNNIKTVEQALQCKELWLLDNGKTLCLKCHKDTETYLSKNKKRDFKHSIISTFISPSTEMKGGIIN